MILPSEDLLQNLPGVYQLSTLTLHPELFGVFSSLEPFGNIVLRPVTLGDERVLSLQQGDFTAGVGKPLTPVVLSPAWERRQGPWQPVGETEAYVLSYDRATGIFSVDGRMAVRPLNDALAVTDGYGRGMNERIEAGQDARGPWLRYSGLELRPVAR